MYVRDCIGYSFDVDCYSEFNVIDKIENEMYKRGLKPKEFKFIREDGCGW